MVASIWYLVMTSILSVGQYFLERRFGRGTTRVTVPRPGQRLMAMVQRRRQSGGGPSG